VCHTEKRFCCRGSEKENAHPESACTVNFVDDYHFINKTWRQIPDEHFLSPNRDNRSVFRYGTLPRTEDLPEPLRGMYSRFLNFNHQSRK